MRWILCILMLFSFKGFSQWKDYVIGVKGDTLNKVDKKGLKQGKWINRFGDVRGEPGYEEEGEYKNNRKEGLWRLYNLDGDLVGVEGFKWGNKDGQCQYFNKSGELIREEGWKAMNPEHQYDTFQIEDVDHLDQYKSVIVKNEGVAIKHGVWKFYNPSTGMILRTESYTLGKFETPHPATKDSTRAVSKAQTKPKEVQEFEKKNAGKKKIKIRDGSVN